MNTRLGICIPTYKRPDQLERCVASVIAACRPHDVGITLVDDSADATNDAVFARLTACYPLLRIHRNRSNLGIDGNILRSVDRCDAEFAWILGEDDRLLPHAVTTVLRRLEAAAEAPAFLYVNYASVDESLTRVLRERSLTIPADDRVDADRFAAESAWSAGFIGACVVNRGRWEKVNPEPYVGTYFAHVGRILESVAGASVERVAEPLVLNRCGTARIFTWTGQAFAVLTGWERMVQALGDRYPAAVREAAIRSFTVAHGLDTLRFLAYLRADGAYNRDAWQQFIRPLPRGCAYQTGARMIAAIPAAALNTVRTVVNLGRHARCRRIVDPAGTAGLIA